jgi:hypothetical protein
MVDEYVHNNPQDPAKEIFERLKAQVTDNNRNINIFMEALASKLKSF